MTWENVQDISLSENMFKNIHYAEKWTIRIYQNVTAAFFCIYSNFYTLIFKMYKNVTLKNALRFSRPNTTFILCSDSCTHFSKSRASQQ